MTTAISKPIFISYSTADTATTEAIRDHLEAAGIAFTHRLRRTPCGLPH